ncbi:MAG: MFS transporter [Chloroflexota bacterium]|nr:MFS transporter [Chloroflexota bacterium]
MSAAQNAAPPAQTPRGGTISFILITAFLNLAGIGIIVPVINFIAGRYVSDPDQLAWVVALLFAVYSLFQFIATPTLGAVSDRYGRRAILLICLFGSAIGYLLLGIGGALWVLFLGRIIDGITGGNIGIIYAYAADITTPSERTRFFGLLGAAAGMGFVIGPAVGGVLYSATGLLEAPLYAAALVTLLNVIWGYFVMPESLPPERRSAGLTLGQLNPLVQLSNIFRIPQIRMLLIAILLWTVALAVVQSNVAYLTEDQLGWTPNETNLLFLLIGLIQVVTQGMLIRPLVDRYGEGRLALTGALVFMGGLILIGLTTLTGFAPLLFVAVLFTSFGNGLIIPTSSALLSQAVGMREQGQIQGGNQSIQALGRVLGPLYGGAAYTLLSPASTYFGAALIMLISAGLMLNALRALAAHKLRLA